MSGRAETPVFVLFFVLLCLFSRASLPKRKTKRSQTSIKTSFRSSPGFFSRRRRPGPSGGPQEPHAVPGLDLNAVLLDFGFRFVFRFGREVQEKRPNEREAFLPTSCRRELPSGLHPNGVLAISWAVLVSDSFCNKGETKTEQRKTKNRTRTTRVTTVKTGDKDERLT